jgi:hypothetical protein
MSPGLEAQVLNRFKGWSVSRICTVTALLFELLGGAHGVFAQELFEFRQVTADVGTGWTWVSGKNEEGVNSASTFRTFRTGIGFAVTRPDPYLLTLPHYIVYITTDFTFNAATVSPQGVQNTITLNPNNTSLKDATSGDAKFGVWTLGPMVRQPISRQLTLYETVAFGALRRTVNFKGNSNAGNLLQPSNPPIAESTATSSAGEFGGGLNFQLSKNQGSAIVFVDGRFIHGFGVHHETKLVPLTVGVRW